MADLTRFDFNAKSFLTSESVRRMSAAEVGQYILLLAEAWLCGRDTTLPDDLPYLARLAHTDIISERVLEKFPVVQTDQGPRRRNDVLFNEWVEAQKRSEAGREKAEKRWGEKPASRGNAIFMPVHKSGIAADDAQSNPIQSVPDQSNPIQPTNTTGGVDFGSENRSQGKLLGEWKNLAVRHKRWFGSQASTSHKDKYADACSKYGEEVVLASFDEWVVAGAKQWVERNDVKQPLFAFWKQLPDLAETNKQIAEADAEDKQKAVVQAAEKSTLAAATEALVQKQMHEHHTFMNYEAPKPNEGDPEEYFK